MLLPRPQRCYFCLNARSNEECNKEIRHCHHGEVITNRFFTFMWLVVGTLLKRNGSFYRPVYT